MKRVSYSETGYNSYMKSVLILLFIIISGSGIYFLYTQNQDWKKERTTSLNTLPTTANSAVPKETIIAENLDTPWALALLPSGDILLTERPGRVRLIKDGHLLPQPVATITNVKEIGEGGLLGIAIHPEFTRNSYVYLYYTYSNNGDNTRNKVVRMKYNNGTLSDEKIVVDAIPGASNHNGGRIAFGPDNYLYITTGDAQEPSQAQDTNSLAGKILRVTDEGQAAPENTFNNLVYSYGHRNPQGITWDNQGRLWATEHGRSGIQSGLDEINLIEKGKNYGWPEIQGDTTQQGMELAAIHSGNATWAPAGIAYSNDSLYFGGLRGRTLYQAIVQDTTVPMVHEYLSGEYGRIREVIAGPDGMLYITTSNHDGRGIPSSQDDRIIKINPLLLQK